jgi:hypothetical protein
MDVVATIEAVTALGTIVHRLLPPVVAVAVQI